MRAFQARPQPPEEDWKVYSVGSRARFRTWGLVGPKAYRRLPIKIRTRQLPTADGPTLLQIELVNDEGPYLTRVPAVTAAYERAFSEIRDEINAALKVPPRM